MTDFALTDCIRPTPSRTLSALIVAAWSSTGRALRPKGDKRIFDVSDRTLADIGMSRVMVNTSSLCFDESGPKR